MPAFIRLARANFPSWPFFLVFLAPRRFVGVERAAGVSKADCLNPGVYWAIFAK